MGELTPAERKLRARIAANARWARETDRHAALAPARTGQVARFEREADPDGVLPPEERARRVENARRAHMARMSLAAARKARDAKQVRKDS